MKLQVHLKSTFGTPRAYPLDAQGKLLTELTGTKTLTLDHLKVAHRMGIKVTVVDWDYDCTDWLHIIERWK